jgi:uncharacterized protein YndB with AHSA1/START domain
MADLIVERKMMVAAPAERIWPLLDDPDRLGSWFGGADRIELLDGAGLGRRQRLHGRWGRRRSEVDQEVVVYDPPRELAWRHLAERLDGRPAPKFAAETVMTITLEPDSAGTLVRLSSRQRPASWPRGLVMRAFGGREIGRLLDESLTRLREALPPLAD